MQSLTGELGSTIIYERTRAIQEHVRQLFSTAHSPTSGALALRQLLCCLPQVELPTDVGYANVFRVIVMQFLDPHNFDVRSVKRSCVHIAHPDGRIIPFDTYNLFYRDGLESRFAAARAPTRTSLSQVFA